MQSKHNIESSSLLNETINSLHRVGLNKHPICVHECFQRGVLTEEKHALLAIFTPLTIDFKCVERVFRFLKNYKS